MREGEHFHRPVEQIVEIVQVEQCRRRCTGTKRERRARALGEELPRHEIAVMLHLGEQDDVARAHDLVRPRRCATRLMLSVVPRVKMISRLPRRGRRQPLSGVFVGGGGPIAQLVESAMDVAVVVFVVMRQGVDDRARFLRGRRIVEIDQRMSVDRLVQDRKILADRLPGPLIDDSIAFT